MQKIVPHLWFDTTAREAAEFYVNVFPDSRVTNVTTLHGTPSGDCDIVSFHLWGCDMMAMSAGPVFTINPSISMMVNFDPSRMENAAEKLEEIWTKLSEGGKELMPLSEYPFSKKYGWIEDKYGFSWQLILTNTEGEERPVMVPSMLFVGDAAGHAEEASDYYLSIFKDSKRGTIARYPAGMEPDTEGSIMFSDFTLANQWMVAMDSGHKHAFVFNEAVSFIINCETQEEMDYFFDKLSAHPESEQCGWVKDRWGVSWQITPTAMNTMMASGDAAAIDRVTQALLPMKRLDLARLEAVYRGE